MITVRKSEDRGHANHGWLDSWHTFSFADYDDLRHRGFRSLRVINEDHVAPRAGFPAHRHRDMEIFSYVLEGLLEHQDSLGNGRVLHPGEIQLMSAGSGVLHSEFNPGLTQPTHFLQIWIRPHSTALEPSYTEWHSRPEHFSQHKVLMISGDGRDESAVIHQDAEVYRLKLERDDAVEHTLASDRGLWLQVVRGQLSLNDVALRAGDAASSESAGAFRIHATENAEALLFDLR